MPGILVCTTYGCLRRLSLVKSVAIILATGIVEYWLTYSTTATSRSGRALSKRGTLKIYRKGAWDFGLRTVIPRIRLKLPPERRSTWKVLVGSRLAVKCKVLLRSRPVKLFPRRRWRVGTLVEFGHMVAHSCSTRGLKVSKGSW